jgi:hypothetical protein
VLEELVIGHEHRVRDWGRDWVVTPPRWARSMAWAVSATVESRGPITGASSLQKWAKSAQPLFKEEGDIR